MRAGSSLPVASFIVGAGFFILVIIVEQRHRTPLPYFGVRSMQGFLRRAVEKCRNCDHEFLWDVESLLATISTLSSGRYDRFLRGFVLQGIA